MISEKRTSFGTFTTQTNCFYPWSFLLEPNKGASLTNITHSVGVEPKMEHSWKVLILEQFVWSQQIDISAVMYKFLLIFFMGQDKLQCPFCKAFWGAKMVQLKPHFSFYKGYIFQKDLLDNFFSGAFPPKILSHF